jgi:hypothetical protein
LLFSAGRVVVDVDSGTCCNVASMEGLQFAVCLSLDWHCRDGGAFTNKHGLGFGDMDNWVYSLLSKLPIASGALNGSEPTFARRLSHQGEAGAFSIGSGFQDSAGQIKAWPMRIHFLNPTWSGKLHSIEHKENAP